MMKNKLFLFAGLALFVLLFPIMSTAKTATSIDATPASATVKAGESITWTVHSTYDDATTEDVSEFALFNIPAAAGGTLLSNSYTSEVPGTYSIPVTVGSFSDTVTLTVVHGDPVSLDLSASGTTITAGEGSISFTGMLRDEIGNTWDATGQMTLTSDDSKAVITGASFTSTHAGLWTITATVGSIKASRQVTVNPSAPSKIAIEGDKEHTLELSKESVLKALITDKYDNVVSPAITWSSSSDSVTVDANGKVTAKKTGKASVTASAATLLASVQFTVTQVTPTNTNASTNTSNVNTNINEGAATNTNGATNENTNTNSNTTDENAEEQSCDAVALWIPIVILAVYTLILYGYYLLIRKEKDNTWWIFPVLLTVIGVIIWNKYMCPDTIMWLPFLLVAIGLAMTGYGRGSLTKSDSNGSGKDPHEQNPMF